NSLYSYEFLGLNIDPPSALVSYSGRNGLRFENTLTFELHQNVQGIAIKYSGGYNPKKVKVCNLILARKIKRELSDRHNYELAHTNAIKSSRKFGSESLFKIILIAAPCRANR
ncbi:MAG: hypothetical protein HN646_02190, partial [Nitrospina sp.]|nr:hypothetical protein [Nitrospina sp.]